MTQKNTDAPSPKVMPEEFSSIIFWVMAVTWVGVAVVVGPIMLFALMMMLDAPGYGAAPISLMSALTMIAIPVAAFCAPFAAYPFEKKGEIRKVMALLFGLPAIPGGMFFVTSMLLDIF